MRLLLDTNVLLWSVVRPQRLSRLASEAIREPSNEKLFSAASIWEIAIKAALRRPDFQVEPGRFLNAVRLDFREVPVTSAVAVGVSLLPLIHRDPFDRLLVAQAIEEGAYLLTADATLASYGSHVLHLA